MKVVSIRGPCSDFLMREKCCDIFINLNSGGGGHGFDFLTFDFSCFFLLFVGVVVVVVANFSECGSGLALDLVDYLFD